MIAKTAALFLGVIFLVVGVLGFVENPIVGADAVFHTDRMHNIIHLGSGILFIVAALLSNELARTFMIVFGFIYLLLGLIGLLTIGPSGMGELLGFLTVNGNDNLLHIGLGIIILLFGITARRDVVTT